MGTIHHCWGDKVKKHEVNGHMVSLVRKQVNTGVVLACLLVLFNTIIPAQEMIQVSIQSGSAFLS